MLAAVSERPVMEPVELLAALFTDPGVRANPFPVYQHLREHAPVLKCADRVWIVTGYEEARDILLDSNFGSRWTTATDYHRRGLAGQIEEVTERLVLFRDEPDHARIRGLVQSVFTPRAVHALSARIELLVRDTLAELDPTDCDLVPEFCMRLPILVIAEMIGLETDDLDRVQQWSHTLALTFDPWVAPDVVEESNRVLPLFRTKIEELVAERSVRPRDDLASKLARSSLSHEEVVDNILLMVIAGHETSGNLLGNGIWAMYRHWDQLQSLYMFPHQTVEEILRWEGPVQQIVRIPQSANEWGIEPGSQVTIALGAINRDPRVFQRPDQFETLVTRTRPHMAFSHGPHYCLGNALARLEAQLALPRVFAQLRRLEITDVPTYRRSSTFRGLNELKVTFDG